MSDMKCTTFVAEKLQNLRIAVIGDVMVDRYFYGEVKRISQEAPVPVNHVKKVRSVPGGAANVAANLANLGCCVYVGGITGDDDNRKILEELLAKDDIDFSGLVKSRYRSTITKMRILGSHQQMLRLDFEEVGGLYPEEADHIKQWLLELMEKGLDGIAVSDYAKGVCSESFCQWVIRMADAHHIPVLVDPKGPHWEKYEGCTFIMPSLKDLWEAAGQTVSNEDGPVLQIAQMARERYRIKNVVVTRSEKGMTLVGEKRTVIHSPASPLEVFDVSGAGDTAAAALIAAVAGGLPLSEAIYMANRAAGIVVGKVGAYRVHRDELLQDLLDEERKLGYGFRVLSWKEIANLAKIWHRGGEEIVFTNGCFDILHVGHVSYLEKAAKLGRRLIVGLNSDDSVRHLRGEPWPVIHELDRARVLASLACVDAVVIFHEDTPAKLIKTIRPDILVVSGKYRLEQVAGHDYAGKVEKIDVEAGYSTEELIKRITSRSVGRTADAAAGSDRCKTV
ncbi:MAG: bifunctional heptose 7-phosphate kinase/heptose 1-phosphate adenyltransferase [Acidaminococcaceae bacterium]|nr:bifunctional heptose 7-phosphate kinase/heptose 1-phosphate adenyltransferase [Acidaminococcaceae bacterium]